MMTWLYSTNADCTRTWRWLPVSARRSHGVADVGCVRLPGALPAAPAAPSAVIGAPQSLIRRRSAYAPLLPPIALPASVIGVGGIAAAVVYGPGYGGIDSGAPVVGIGSAQFPIPVLDRATPVPEPSSAAVLAVACAVLVVLRRRRV